MAVYTRIEDEDVKVLLSQYPLGNMVACKEIAEGVENSNFILTTTEGVYVLTLYEKRVCVEDLPFFLGIMEHLSSVGFESPVPIKRLDGNMLSVCAGRPAAIVSFLNGRCARYPDVYLCGQLGQVIGRMHVFLEKFKGFRHNSLSLSGWQTLFSSCAKQIDSVLPGACYEIESELSFLEKNWPSTLPRGIIHGDAFPDNVLFSGRKFSGLIDYYFACNEIIFYDIAVCINSWCFEDNNMLNITKARQLLKSYKNVRSVSEQELQALPVLCRGAAIRFLLTRLYDWIHQSPDALVAVKAPEEFLSKLRFHQKVKSACDYGFF